MPDGQEYTDVQLKDGTTLRFKGKLTSDQTRQKVSVYRAQKQAQEQASAVGRRPLEQATLPGERKAGEAPNPLSRFAEVTTGVPHPIDQIAGREIPMMANRPGEYGKAALNTVVGGPARMVNQTLSHPIDTAVGLTGGKQFPEDVAAKRYGSAIADVLGGAANVYALGKSAESVKPTAEAIGKRTANLALPTPGEAYDAARTSAKQAQKLYEEAIAPEGAKVQDQSEFREDFKRAQPYIADETRKRPITQGEGGVFRAASRLRSAQDRLWQQYVAPVIQNYAEVQRPGTPIAHAIRDSFDAFDERTRPAMVRAGDNLAVFYDRPMSMGEMAENLTRLNNDKTVSRFYDMTPNEQATAMISDPGLRAKIVARKALADTLFYSIDDIGGETLGQNFKEARKDYGALNSIENRLRNVRVPTETNLVSRAMNSIRGFISPFGMHAYTHIQPETMLRYFNNPNYLIPRSFNMLGRTPLEPSPSVVGPAEWYASPSRMLPPAGGRTPRSGMTGFDPTLGKQAPGGPPAAKAPPIRVGGQGPVTALLKIPGQAPVTVLISREGILEGSPKTPVPQFPEPANKLLPAGRPQPGAGVPPSGSGPTPMRQLEIMAEGPWKSRSFPEGEQGPTARVVGTGRTRHLEIWDVQQQRWIPMNVNLSGEK